jgi:predicted helicase
MERYKKTNKKSNIKTTLMIGLLSGNPRYVLDLLLSVINVSVQTTELVKELPKMKFE